MSESVGELEQLVLLALIRLGDRAYGVTVQRELIQRARRHASLGTVYTTLTRLEHKGLVIARIGEPTAERGGRRKRYFSVLPAGQRALRRSLNALERMASGLPTLSRSGNS
jgi:DNA-binding PadR family transcriptional regulator